MNSNIFFKKKNINIKKIYSNISFKKNFIINDIKPLEKAKKKDIIFFDSIKYKNAAIKTKAGACITTKALEKFYQRQFKK